jgi:hypothetical protein
MAGGLSEILLCGLFKPYSLKKGLSPAEMPEGGITARSRAANAAMSPLP